MTGVTTKSRIINYLKSVNGFVSGSELEAQAEDWGTKSSVISRRCRELANEGKIQRTLGYRRTVQYGLNSLPQQFYTAEEANNYIKSLGV